MVFVLHTRTRPVWHGICPTAACRLYYCRDINSEMLWVSSATFEGYVTS